VQACLDRHLRRRAERVVMAVVAIVQHSLLKS